MDSGYRSLPSFRWQFLHNPYVHAQPLLSRNQEKKISEFEILTALTPPPSGWSRWQTPAWTGRKTDEWAREFPRNQENPRGDLASQSVFTTCRSPVTLIILKCFYEDLPPNELTSWNIIFTKIPDLRFIYLRKYAPHSQNVRAWVTSLLQISKGFFKAPVELSRNTGESVILKREYT